MTINKSLHGRYINHAKTMAVLDKIIKSNRKKMSVIQILIRISFNQTQLNLRPIIRINGDQITILKIMILLINIVEEVMRKECRETMLRICGHKKT